MRHDDIRVPPSVEVRVGRGLDGLSRVALLLGNLAPVLGLRDSKELTGTLPRPQFYGDHAASIAPARVTSTKTKNHQKISKRQIAYTGFTKERSIGRYGLLPTRSRERKSKNAIRQDWSLVESQLKNGS